MTSDAHKKPGNAIRPSEDASTGSVNPDMSEKQRQDLWGDVREWANARESPDAVECPYCGETQPSQQSLYGHLGQCEHYNPDA